MLNIKWIRLALLAFAPADADDISAVTHEPILVPRMMNRTSFPPVPMVRPATDIAIITDVIAELDCTSAVSRIPIKNSRNGFVTVSKTP